MRNCNWQLLQEPRAAALAKPAEGAHVQAGRSTRLSGDPNSVSFQQHLSVRCKQRLLL